MWPNPQLPADLVTLTEKIHNRKLHFLNSVQWVVVAVFQHIDAGTYLGPCQTSVIELSCSKKTPTEQKMKFSIKGFFSKCDQIHSFLWLWSQSLKKSFMENFIFCAVVVASSKPALIFGQNRIEENLNLIIKA